MRFINVYSLISLLSIPVGAQFGLPKNNKAGTSFEELNERMKELGIPGENAGDGLEGLGDLQAMIANAFNDPETMKAFEQIGAGMQEAMAKLGEMDPDEMQKQLNEVTSMLTSGDMIENVMGKKDEVLANLEKTGLVTAEELEKFKNDPAYFEEQMKSAFDQMKGIFSDPSIVDGAANAMKTMQDVMSNPVIKEINELMLADSVTDTDIEEMRLKLLQNKDSLDESGAAAMMGTMLDDVLDAEKFKTAVNDGRKLLKNLGMGGGEENGGVGAGAGVGEL